MKRGKIVNLLMVVFFIGALSGCATPEHKPSTFLPDENAELVSFKPGLEPDGFAGIKWETEISTLPGMMYYRNDPSHGGITFYVREGEPFKLGKGKVRLIQYGFWKGKFYVGMVTTQGLSNWDALKAAVFDQCGKGARPFINKEEYLWVGENSIGALRYDETSKAGTFYIRSESLKKKMESEK